MTGADGSQAKRGGRKRGSNAPRCPSDGASNLRAVLREKYPGERDMKAALKAWFEAKGVVWRPIGAYLTGTEANFPRSDLLPEFVREVTGKEYRIEDFISEAERADYVREFCRNNPSSESLLKSIKGRYRCFRPGSELLKSVVDYKVGEEKDISWLEIECQEGLRPGAFRYTTVKKEGEAAPGVWFGHVVANFPHIYLFGFCPNGEDAAYLLMRQHPVKAYANRMLVGIQSLLLANPAPDGPKYAVSRPLVAIRESLENDQETLNIANAWLANNCQTPGLLINLADISSRT